MHLSQFTFNPHFPKLNRTDTYSVPFKANALNPFICHRINVTGSAGGQEATGNVFRLPWPRKLDGLTGLLLSQREKHDYHSAAIPRNGPIVILHLTHRPSEAKIITWNRPASKCDSRIPLASAITRSWYRQCFRTLVPTVACTGTGTVASATSGTGLDDRHGTSHNCRHRAGFRHRSASVLRV